MTEQQGRAKFAIERLSWKIEDLEAMLGQAKRVRDRGKGLRHNDEHIKSLEQQIALRRQTIARLERDFGLSAAIKADDKTMNGTST